ncbi:mucin-5AC-like isoform X2 [Ornithodoros turicata]|uniref:mucin-5AC-like isoform X2 n=1 Tax=Ornithodoros turicata TaxID=34597 RepID=UPI0031397969
MYSFGMASPPGPPIPHAPEGITTRENSNQVNWKHQNLTVCMILLPMVLLIAVPLLARVAFPAHEPNTTVLATTEALPSDSPNASSKSHRRRATVTIFNFNESSYEMDDDPHTTHQDTSFGDWTKPSNLRPTWKAPNVTSGSTNLFQNNTRTVRDISNMPNGNTTLSTVVMSTMSSTSDNNHLVTTTYWHFRENDTLPWKQSSSTSTSSMQQPAQLPSGSTSPTDRLPSTQTSPAWKQSSAMQQPAQLPSGFTSPTNTLPSTQTSPEWKQSSSASTSSPRDTQQPAQLPPMSTLATLPSAQSTPAYLPDANNRSEKGRGKTAQPLLTKSTEASTTSSRITSKTTLSATNAREAPRPRLRRHTVTSVTISITPIEEDTDIEGTEKNTKSNKPSVVGNRPHPLQLSTSTMKSSTFALRSSAVRPTSRRTLHERSSAMEFRPPIGRASVKAATTSAKSASATGIEYPAVETTLCIREECKTNDIIGSRPRLQRQTLPTTPTPSEETETGPRITLNMMSSVEADSASRIPYTVTLGMNETQLGNNTPTKSPGYTDARLPGRRRIASVVRTRVKETETKTATPLFSRRFSSTVGKRERLGERSFRPSRFPNKHVVPKKTLTKVTLKQHSSTFRQRTRRPIHRRRLVTFVNPTEYDDEDTTVNTRIVTAITNGTHTGPAIISSDSTTHNYSETTGKQSGQSTILWSTGMSAGYRSLHLTFTRNESRSTDSTKFFDELEGSTEREETNTNLGVSSFDMQTTSTDASRDAGDVDLHDALVSNGDSVSSYDDGQVTSRGLKGGLNDTSGWRESTTSEETTFPRVPYASSPHKSDFGEATEPATVLSTSGVVSTLSYYVTLTDATEYTSDTAPLTGETSTRGRTTKSPSRGSNLD